MLKSIVLDTASSMTQLQTEGFETAGQFPCIYDILGGRRIWGSIPTGMKYSFCEIHDNTQKSSSLEATFSYRGVQPFLSIITFIKR